MQGASRALENLGDVRPKSQSPRRDSTRPPEPQRPAPSKRPTLTLVAVQARRRSRRRPYWL